MNHQHRTVLQAAGRLATAAGIAIALSSAVAVAFDAPELRARPSATDAAVVRLEPVVVTIAANRFDAIRAEAAPPMIGYQPVKPPRAGKPA